MLYTRRDFGKIAAAVPAIALGAAKPNSNFGGVQVGVITYSFRALPVEDTLKYCLECGVNAVELMSNVAETYAGAPLQQRPPMGGGPRGGGRPQMTPEMKAEMQKSAEALKKWRTSASMDKFKEFRRTWENAGVKIYAFKLPPTMAMSDEEYEYIWTVGKTLGANHVTMELPTDDALLQRVGQYAAKQKLPIAFHTHGQGGASGFDKALGASRYTMLNFDVGHYYGVNGESPVPLVEKYASRISSLHLKDRKSPKNGGAGMPWGEGETPLKEVLQLMRKRRLKFPATVEYEYNTPEGSSVIAEVKKCVNYCRSALA
jgi:sugar phosphate isomerase/epimerase